MIGLDFIRCAALCRQGVAHRLIGLAANVAGGDNEAIPVCRQTCCLRVQPVGECGMNGQYFRKNGQYFRKNT